jgi:hypothetical protein
MESLIETCLEAEKIRNNFRRYCGWEYSELDSVVEELRSKCGSVLKTKEQIYLFLFQDPPGNPPGVINTYLQTPLPREYDDEDFGALVPFNNLCENCQKNWVNLVNQYCPQVKPERRLKAAAGLYEINYGVIPMEVQLPNEVATADELIDYASRLVDRY